MVIHAEGIMGEQAEGGGEERGTNLEEEKADTRRGVQAGAQYTFMVQETVESVAAAQTSNSSAVRSREVETQAIRANEQAGTSLLAGKAQCYLPIDWSSKQLHGQPTAQAVRRYQVPENAFVPSAPLPSSRHERASRGRPKRMRTIQPASSTVSSGPQHRREV
ncbi:hypothetical protein BJY59DRAFT_699137 [Rhodotorula toruloides]